MLLPDGRAWFTMDLIQGDTFEDVIRASEADDPSALHRLVGILRRVSEAVAFAHSKNVVHRDLKPANVMLGAHGEVLVLDWGLAKVLGADMSEPEIQTVRTEGGQQTVMGRVAGTPAYMSPEQAIGAVEDISPRSDVYSLGGMLAFILTRQAPKKRATRNVLTLAAAGEHPTIPQGLARLSLHALQLDPEDRPPDAGPLAESLGRWLEGAQQREQASEIAREAQALASRGPDLLARADALEKQGRDLLAAIEPWKSEEHKHDAWDLLDQARELRRQANLAEVEVDQRLLGAIQVAHDLADARVALAERYRDRHRVAEETRDLDRAARLEAYIRTQTALLPTDDPRRTGFEAYLDGAGAFSLVTDPPGAKVTLYRYVERHRRLVEAFVRELGTTPIVRVPLPMGSYLCTIEHPDREPVRYPFEITRQGHWDGIAPGDDAPTPVWLPPKGWLAADEVYVPAGWFRVGGDPTTPNALPAGRMWMYPYVIQRFQVTNAEFIAFLDDLVAQGRKDEAELHAPLERTSGIDGAGAKVYGFDGQRYFLQPDLDGDMWDPQWPVFLINLAGARAYLDWLADKTGRPWRPLGEMEFEKAARGVDGRWMPWGDHLDPSWTNMGMSHAARRLPSRVREVPMTDSGPSGVRAMAGNVYQFCNDCYVLGEWHFGGRAPEPVPVDIAKHQRPVLRGGAYSSSPSAMTGAYRLLGSHEARNSHMGIRGAYRVIPDDV